MWVGGLLEGQATWKISLTFDPFDSLAVVRSHNFWHWPWVTWNRSQIVPNRIKPRIIPPLKYFWRFDWQKAQCSYSGVEPARGWILLSDVAHTSELHLSPNWPDILSHHLQECGLFHAAVTMGKSRINMGIIRLGQSLLSCLQNKQSHTAQQSSMESSLSNLSKLGS